MCVETIGSDRNRKQFIVVLSSSQSSCEVFGLLGKVKLLVVSIQAVSRNLTVGTSS